MELKEVTYEVLATGDKMPSGYYMKADVDAVLAEKDKEITLLKERICNGDVSRATWIDTCLDQDKEIAELKKKLENVQASMYADVVDANMENRRLKRALYKACANWAHATIYYSGVHEYDEFKWENMETECLKKAEEYK